MPKILKQSYQALTSLGKRKSIAPAYLTANFFGPFSPSSSPALNFASCNARNWSEARVSSVFDHALSKIAKKRRFDDSNAENDVKKREKKDNSINDRIDTVFAEIRQLNERLGCNLFDNERWREVSLIELMRRNGYGSMKLLRSRVGRDASCLGDSLSASTSSSSSSSSPPTDALVEIEFKTSKIVTKSLRKSSGFAEFSRQNTAEGRLTALYGYDAIVIGVFQAFHREPLLAVAIRSEHGMTRFRNIIAEKQRAFREACEKKRTSMLNGRDSIRVTLREIYDEFPASEYELYHEGVRIHEVADLLSRLRKGVALKK